MIVEIASILAHYAAQLPYADLVCGVITTLRERNNEGKEIRFPGAFHVKQKKERD